MRFHLALRIILGGLFIAAGIAKLRNPALFHGDILSFRLVSGEAAVLIALYLPWIEITVGAALILHRAFRGAVLLCASLLLIFSVYLGSAWIRGIDINCGCFGGAGSTDIPLALLRNFLMLVGIAVLVKREGSGTRYEERTPNAVSDRR